jgi:hypothetical protein
MITPELLLKAAKLAFDDLRWYTQEDGNVYAMSEDDNSRHDPFDPFDPAKGDLAALQTALEKDGWEFWWSHTSQEFRAQKPTFKDGNYLYADAKTPAERALKCVKAMP